MVERHQVSSGKPLRSRNIRHCGLGTFRTLPLRLLTFVGQDFTICHTMLEEFFAWISGSNLADYF